MSRDWPDMWRFRTSSAARSLGFQADLVIDGTPKPLLAAQVPLRRLHRHVPQQELDLLQLAAGGVAEPRAGSTTIVGR